MSPDGNWHTKHPDMPRTLEFLLTTCIAHMLKSDGGLGKQPKKTAAITLWLLDEWTNMIADKELRHLHLSSDRLSCLCGSCRTVINIFSPSLELDKPSGEYGRFVFSQDNAHDQMLFKKLQMIVAQNRPKALTHLMARKNKRLPFDTSCPIQSTLEAQTR